MYSGTFLSSLDMAGVSLTILPVDDQHLRWLDAPTSALAWPNAPRRRATPAAERLLSPAPVLESKSRESKSRPHRPQTAQGKQADRAIRAACAALLGAAPRLTDLDQIVGDGDLGVSMTRGAKAVEKALPAYPLDDLPNTLKALGNTLRSELGGSSGPLYGVLLIRAGSALEQRDLRDLKNWAEALRQACDAISELGGAKLGDRTMLEALVPFAETLKSEAAQGKSPAEALEAAANAAEEGAQGTAKMLPRRGRSSYLGERALGHPDPGAIAASIWLRAVVHARENATPYPA